MSDLCELGRSLHAKASAYDHVFKSRLNKFFSDADHAKSESEMREIEQLGVHHRELDEAFRRHQRLCETCEEALISRGRRLAVPAPLSPLD
jgi:RNA polymerase-binding transcription factor DksA